MNTLRFVPEVEKDALAGFMWYETKAAGLGEEFLRIFYAGALQIQRNPQIYPEIDTGIRRFLLRRFPYAIYFITEKSETIVLGLFHCARDPRTIRKELADRNGT